MANLRTFLLAVVLLTTACAGGADEAGSSSTQTTRTTSPPPPAPSTTAAPTTSTTSTTTTLTTTISTTTTTTTAAPASGQDIAEILAEVVRTGRESYDGPDEAGFARTYGVLMSLVEGEPLLDEAEALQAGEVACISLDAYDPTLFLDLNIDTLADTYNISSVHALLIMVSASAELCTPDVAEDMIEALDTAEL